MKLHITNYTNGQIIEHSSIVVLQGYLSLEEDHQKEKLELKSEKNVPALRNILEIFKSTKPNELISYNYSEDSFLCLLHLTQGNNSFNFRNKLTKEIISSLELVYIPCLIEFSVKILQVFSQEDGDCQDSEEISENIKKTNLGLKLIQSFYGEKLFDNGFSRRSFCIYDDESPKVIKLDINSKEILKMDGESLWEYLARFITAQRDIWDERCKYVAFMAHPWKSSQNGQSQSQENSNIALGGGGLALVGSEYLSIWPKNINQVLDTLCNSEPLGNSKLDCASRFGDIDRTVGSLYAATLGGLAHEIGHIFDLGHTEFGLMSSEFHRMKTFFAPCFTHSNKTTSSLSKTHVMSSSKVGPLNEKTEEDVVSIGHSCATLLHFHRWFVPNNFNGRETGTNDGGPMLIKNKIISKLPLTVVQIRDLENGNVLKDWTFPVDSKNNTKEFLLAKNHIPLECETGKAQVVAQDTSGSILKTGIDRNLLSQSFTVIQRK